MPKPALALLIVIAALAVAAVLVLGGGEPGDTGLDETATTVPTATTSAGSTDPASLRPATVATATSAAPNGAPTGPRTAGSSPAGNGNGGEAASRELAAGERVAGVIRAPGGLPAAGAQVLLTVHTQQGPKIRSVRTDHEGRFETTAPDAGRATLQVQAPGLAKVAQAVEPGKAVEIEPPPAVEIAGVVRDGQGTPLPGAFVAADEIGAPVVPSRTVAQTGPHGEFTLGGLRRDARYKLSATHPTLAPSEPVEVTAPAAGAMLTLYEGTTLIVKVFDADGGVLPKPPSKSTQNDWRSLQSFAELHGPGGSRTLSNWTTANSEQIEVTGLPAGEFTFAVQVRGHGKAEKQGIQLPGNGTLEVEVRLPRGGFVVVTVTDAQGKLLPGATVADAAQLGTPFGLLVQDETGSEGAARVGPLPAGKHRLRASRFGYVAGFVEVQVQAGLESTAALTLASK